MKLFKDVIYSGSNKLEYLSLADIYSQVRTETSQVAHQVLHFEEGSWTQLQTLD